MYTLYVLSGMGILDRRFSRTPRRCVVIGRAVVCPAVRHEPLRVETPNAQRQARRWQVGKAVALTARDHVLKNAQVQGRASGVACTRCWATGLKMDAASLLKTAVYTLHGLKLDIYKNGALLHCYA